MSTLFVRNLYVSGNGYDFSTTLESNILDYVICSRAEASSEASDALLDCGNVPAAASQE